MTNIFSGYGYQVGMEKSLIYTLRGIGHLLIVFPTVRTSRRVDTQGKVHYSKVW